MSRKLLLGLVHDRVVTVIILITTVVLLLRGFPGVCAVCDPTLFWIEYALTAFFVLEMVVKLSVLGFRTFWSHRWNRFDFIVVLATTPVLLTPWWDVQDVAFLLILRSARLMRLLWWVRFIPERERLWAGVRRALHASVGVFVWLAIYNLMLAMVAHALFSKLAPQHFEDPLRSMYSLFRVFTVEGWYEIPDLISAAGGAEMGMLARGFFVFAVGTGGILGLSLANAIFTDQMVVDNTDQLEGQVEQLRQELSAANREHHLELVELRERLEQVLARLAPR